MTTYGQLLPLLSGAGVESSLSEGRPKDLESIAELEAILEERQES